MSQQDIQFKAIPGQFNIDEAQGVVECFVAGIGNKDSVGDVLITGAFTKSLTRRKPRVVWGHNWNDPIGKVLEIYEVAPGDRRLPSKMLNAGIGGLYARVQFNLNSEKGREAFANVAFFGQEQEWSIGYKTLDSIFDPNIQANILKEVELYEVSPVLHGANQLTGTISVKSDETAEKHMPGMMMPHHYGMGQGPKIVVVRQDDNDDDDDKPIFSEGLAQPIDDNQKERLVRELQSRSGSSIQLVSATESTAKFRRMTSDGRSVMYRIGYHTPDNYVTFMFGKPELADGQQIGGPRTVVPSQMPSMPMQVKPRVATDSTNYVVSPEYVMPKGEDFEKSAFDEELENLAQIFDETFDVKVGRTLSSRNMSKLKTVLETLQDIVSSAEKDVESKSDYLIPVQIEKAFETKQLLDPIFDYHRVESHVTEDGIVITTGVTQEFIEAIGVAEKALGRTLSGGLGKLGRAGRGAVNFDPKAWDGDGDGIVQEGTPYSRPAIPGINDRASGGRVDANAATRAWQNQRRAGMASNSFRGARMNADDNFDEYDEAWGPPMRRTGRGMADDPTGDAASENIDRDRNAGAVRRGLASSTSGSRGKPDPIKREGEFHGGKVYDEFKGQYVQGEVVALSDIYGDDRPGYAIVGIYDTDGQGTVGYFYGGDDEEFETIEDAMAFLENIEEEGENDRFYDEPKFRSVDRKRSAGKPGNRPLAGLSSSTGDIVSDPPQNLINDIANAAVRAVGRSGDETRLIDGAKEVLANLTNEKLKDSVGKSVSNARKQLAEMLSDEKVIEEFESRKAIEDFMDEVGYAVQKMLDLHVGSVKKNGTSVEKEEIEEIVDNAKSKFDDDFNELVKASKDFWNKRRKPGRLDKTVKEAKKTAAEDRNSLMDSIRKGGEPEDLEATLGSISKMFEDSSEGIISGTISLEDLNYEIERAIEQIVENDPSIDPEELVNEFADALREGASKDGANPLIVALAKEFGDEKITGGDLIDYLNDTRQNSVYRPDRGKIEKEKLRGFASRTGNDEGSNKREMDMTLAEYAELDKVLKKYMDDSQVDGIGADEDMQVVQNILDKLDESSAANDAIPLTDKEIDDYIDTLTRMRDNGPVEDSGDKESIDKLIDSLKKTKDSKDGTYESDALQQAGTRLTPPPGGRGGAAKRSRPFKSSNGTINPHKKLDIELNDSEIGELRDELQGFIKISDNPAPLRAIAEKLEKATNGKFSVEKEEYEEVIKEIDKMRTSKGVVTSDVVGVLEQAAESQKGKYSSSDFGGGGGFSSSTGGRKNNGAPSDIPETMQKQLIMWGRQQGGLRLVQEAIQKFDQDKGTLPASYWRRLRTMYENMGPGSASGGARRSAGRNSGPGRRGRVGFSSSSDGYEGRSKRPGMSPGMRPADFEVRPRDGEPTGVGKGGAMGTKPDPKFTGDSFDQAKPEKWDELTIDEKWEWMLGEGSPEKGGTMSPAAYEGAMKKLGDEEAKEEAKRMSPEERRKARAESRESQRAQLSDNEKERLSTERAKRQEDAEKQSKRVKEEATAEKAQAKRQTLLDGFNEWIDDSVRQLSEMEYDETDINPDADNIWDTVSTILGVEDITPKSLKEAIDELSSYVDITSGENAYEKKSLARANALLKKLLKMQSEYSEDKWFNGKEGGRSGFQSSTGGKPRPPRGIRPRPGTPEMPQSNAKREGDIKRLSTLIEQVVAELEAKRQKPSPKKGRMGFSSSTGKTMITDEATFFKDVENSLAKEIRAAQKAGNSKAITGLTKLQEVIKRNEASKTGDRRTNVGSIYMTMDEVDSILDGLQFALDQQIDAGGDKRIDWYSRLIEKIAAAAMSTFIDKSTTEIGSTRRTVTNKDGVKKKINILPEA